jgi:hypothetical protein
MAAESNVIDRHPSETKSYGEFVRRAAQADGPSQVFLNRNVEDAPIVIGCLFEKATRSMEILTGELHPVVYGSQMVIDAAVQYLRRTDGRITILVEQQKDYGEHRFFARLRDEGWLRTRVELYMVNELVRARYTYHFAVADAAHFRFEQNRQILEALVQFNNPEVGGKLHSLFESLKSSAQLLRFF